MNNSDNLHKGVNFQSQVLKWFQENHDDLEFEEEVSLSIGKPSKKHKFDIVDKSKTYAIECKRLTWTETGNVPSAKITSVNEAAFFLSFLPKEYKKYIVMLYSKHSNRQETLAHYYFRTYKHLLGNIIVAEYNPDNNSMLVVADDDSGEQSSCERGY